MAQLIFNVENQTLRRTDTFEPVALSLNYLKAEFRFLTDDWQDGTETAVFESNGESYKMLLDRNNQCFVPWEVIQNSGYVYVSLYNASRITTNKAKFFINETGHIDNVPDGTEPTPEMYDQLINLIDYNAANIDGGTFDDWNEN